MINCICINTFIKSVTYRKTGQIPSLKIKIDRATLLVKKCMYISIYTNEMKIRTFRVIFLYHHRLVYLIVDAIDFCRFHFVSKVHNGILFQLSLHSWEQLLYRHPQLLKDDELQSTTFSFSFDPTIILLSFKWAHASKSMMISSPLRIILAGWEIILGGQVGKLFWQVGKLF